MQRVWSVLGGLRVRLMLTYVAITIFAVIASDAAIMYVMTMRAVDALSPQRLAADMAPVARELDSLGVEFGPQQSILVSYLLAYRREPFLADVRYNYGYSGEYDFLNLRSHPERLRLALLRPGGEVVAAAPGWENTGCPPKDGGTCSTPQGMVAYRILPRSGLLLAAWAQRLDTWTVIRDYYSLDYFTMMPYAVGMAAATGMLFGWLIAGWLASRFGRISAAASAWSRGELSVQAPEDSEDEVGLLSRRLNQMAEELRQVIKLEQQVAALEERNRLARDLHDSVKQQIFALAMQVGAAVELLNRTSPDIPGALGRVQQAQRLAASVQAEMATILEELRRPSGGSDAPLADRLRAYVAQWSTQHGIESTFTAGYVPEMPAEMEAALFRIAQEALSNTARHARARRAEVHLGCQSGEVELRVSDDGIGFSPTRVKPGMGLDNINQRASGLPGGRCHIDSEPHRGTRVRVVAELQKVRT